MYAYVVDLLVFCQITFDCIGTTNKVQYQFVILILILDFMYYVEEIKIKVLNEIRYKWFLIVPFGFLNYVQKEYYFKFI